VNDPAPQAGPSPITSDVGSFAGSWFDPGTRIQVRASLAPDDPSSEEDSSADADSEVSSFLIVTPTIRRLFAWEVDTAPTSYDVRGTLKRIDQDGTYPCPQRGCYDALPTLEAYTCHFHIHLIHEGYVIRFDYAICVGVDHAVAQQAKIV